MTNGGNQARQAHCKFILLTPHDEQTAPPCSPGPARIVSQLPGLGIVRMEESTLFNDAGEVAIIELLRVETPSE